MTLSLSHWYPRSGVVLDLSIPDLCPFSSSKQFRMAKDSFKDFFENINIILKNKKYL